MILPKMLHLVSVFTLFAGSDKFARVVTFIRVLNYLALKEANSNCITWN